MWAQLCHIEIVEKIGCVSQLQIRRAVMLGSPVVIPPFARVSQHTLLDKDND